MFEKSANLFKIVKKYMRKDVAIPNLILTRVARDEKTEWKEYYREFDKSLKDLFASIPKNTIIFLNCQVNPGITLLVEGQPLKLSSTVRNPCFMLAI